MAKETILKDKQGNELYPVTHIDCIINAPNVKVEEYIGDVEEVTGVTKEDIIKETFIKLWNTAVGNYGTYNRDSGYFELNGLTDITYEEALEIYTNGRTTYPYPYRLSENVRTNILLRTAHRAYTAGAGELAMPGIASYASKLEVLRLGDDDNAYQVNMTDYKGFSLAFYGAIKLRKVIGAIDVGNVTSIPTSVFASAIRLEHICLRRLKTSLPIYNSNVINLQSLQYIINEATNTTPITITVHADVYSKLTDESNTEWYAVNELAKTKNITFATV